MVTDGVTGRGLLSAGSGTGLILLAGWLAWRNLGFAARDGYVFWVPIALWLTTMGLLCWGSALGGEGRSTRARIASSWRAGWWLGGTGLALGFIGPLVITPRATLGPLLGILLTGPAGFVLGALVGALLPVKGERAQDTVA